MPKAVKISLESWVGHIYENAFKDMNEWHANETLDKSLGEVFMA